MNVIKRICPVVLPAFILVVLVGCVSKQEYLMKVEESERSNDELEALKSKYGTLKTDLEKEKTDLKVQIVSLKQEIDRLEGENTNLEEILKSTRCSDGSRIGLQNEQASTQL